MDSSKSDEDKARKVQYAKPLAERLYPQSAAGLTCGTGTGPSGVCASQGLLATSCSEGASGPPS